MSNIFYGHVTNQTVERWLNQLVGPFVTIFTLHRPAPKNGSYNGVDEHLLERCLQYATKKNYRFASIDQLVLEAMSGKSRDKRPTLCFTLDDGYADQASRLLPLLLNYKTSPSLFVITDFIDQKVWPWDAKLTYLIWNTPLKECTLTVEDKTLVLDLSTPQNRIIARRSVIQTLKRLNSATHDEYILQIAKQCKLKPPTSIPDEFVPVTWQTLRDLEQQGLKIGSHTKSHIVFSAADAEQIAEELKLSSLKLQSELVSPSSVFCYPLGTKADFSPDHIQLVKEAGYKAAITTISNTTSLKSIRDNPFEIKRIGFPNTFEKFTRYISWLEAIRSKVPF